ncbi:hypothetical protein V9T40_006668 [Parthenolecanium corni]|uniref:Cytochrome P450 n=1 Tax=Parthenolecanium corni TaxID=536013 RepID=A0AAN9TP39_9HEMI
MLNTPVLVRSPKLSSIEPSGSFCSSIANGHIMLNKPVLVRSPKSSSIEPNRTHIIVSLPPPVTDTVASSQFDKCDTPGRFVIIANFFSVCADKKAKMWLFGVLIAFASILALVLLRKRFNYWRKNGVPSTSPWTILGDLWPTFVKGRIVPFVYNDICKAFPNEKYVGFYDLLSPNLMVRDPELIGTIMVKDFAHFQDRMTVQKRTSRLDYHLITLCGEQWKSVRTKIVPTFSANKLKSMIPMMEYCAQILDSHLREKALAGESFDAKETSARFTLDVIGCCMFGLHFNSLDDPDSEYRNIGKIIIDPGIKGMILQVLRFTWPKLLEYFNISELPTPLLPFFTKLLKQSEEFRKHESTKRNDMMQLFLDIRDQEEQNNVTDDSGISFNDNVILSNIFLFYVAGFETTAATISFCLYELALNPEVQSKLRQEVRTVLKANGGELTYDTLKRLKYLDMVISETLRKYPPAPFINRVCTEAYKLPGSSFTLEPGTRVTLVPYSIHHDEQFYPNPKKFDPERFTPENIEARPPFTYLPFGDGPRMCIASRFAKIEMRLILTRLVSKYEFTPGPKTEIPIQLRSRIFQIIPKNGIHLQVKLLEENL